MDKRRFIFINNMAAPYQVKFCTELQEYFEAEIWFYVHLEKNRPAWWAIPLGNKCKVLEGSFYLPGLNYNNLGLLKKIKAFNPDIILLGGFFLPTHYFIKKWAKKHSIKVIILSERIRLGKENSIANILKVNFKKWTFSLFKDINLLFAMGEKPRDQYITQFGFDENKVVLAHYPQDIDKNLQHSLRETKKNASLIFPNKLVHSYNPLFALEVFALIHKRYPGTKLTMNASGELRQDCVAYIQKNNLSDSVSFLDEIKSWDDLPEIYRSADIALFTATDSNGPNTLIECMASGTGVVLSKYIHNTSSYCRNGENCFICDLDTQCFVESITKYIENEGLIASHGELSKKLVAKGSMKATAKLYYDIIETKLYSQNMQKEI